MSTVPFAPSSSPATESDFGTRAGSAAGLGYASARLGALVANRTAWRSLASDFYTDPELFALDMKAVFERHWIFAATDAEIPDPGDYVTVDFGPYSVIVVRDDDEQVSAFHNVCRHRGARIFSEGSGSVGNIVCGYHHWTYGTDGQLRYAESQPADFDPSCFGLRRVHARSVAGLIFLCLSQETPSDFDEVAAIVESYIGPHKLATAKVAAQIDLVEHGNWKLTMENNRECYHCSGHPELACTVFPLFGYDPANLPPRLQQVAESYRQAMSETAANWDALGLPYGILADLDSRPTGYFIEREPMNLAGESFTLDGAAAVKRSIGDFPTAKLGRVGLHLQPNSWYHVLGDHAITFAALPVAPDKTLLRTTWLVHAEAEEGVDYDLETLTAVWKATNHQDAVFVAKQQRGVSNPAYLPGPYSSVEYMTEAFVNWYVTRLKLYLGIGEDS